MEALVVVVIDEGFNPHSPADRSSLHRETLRAYTATRTRAGAVWRGWVANSRREERVRFYGIKPQFNAHLSR